MEVDGPKREAIDTQTPIRELEEKLARSANGHPRVALSPAWWQEHLLDWASQDPHFRVKLLRFVDVLPTLRTPAAIADHVRQYFRDGAPEPIHAASAVAAQPVFRPILSRVVRQGVFSMAHRFIAGSSPEQALPALRELAKQGAGHTVDLLGEATLSDAEAGHYLERYTDLLQALVSDRERVSPHGLWWEGVPPVNISVKLSALCAQFEPAAPEFVSEVVRERLRPLLRLARERHVFINFDMEQYRYKDLAQRIFRDLALEPEFAGFTELGIVVQAYLRDGEEDVLRMADLARERGTPFTIRLVKGAYWDEERIVASQNGWPVPVFEEKVDTDASYERCTDHLLDAWPNLKPAFGTHNPHSVAQAIAKLRQRGLRGESAEFQVLYGMAEGLRMAIADEGYRTRVYVPVGQIIPGMAYLVRRLLENTSNQAWFHQGLSEAMSGAPAARRRAANTPRWDIRGFRNAGLAEFHQPEAREGMKAALLSARKSFGASYPLLVGERRLADRAQAEVRYPAEPEAVLGRVAQASREDVNAAVEQAVRVFPSWRDRPAGERADILRHAAGLLEERRFSLAAIIVYESGKPWREADGDVVEAIDYLRYYALEAERMGERRHIGDVLGEENEYFHQGRGVAAIISPWNFPLAIITGMSSAALAAGNAAILKPAAPSPIIAYHLVEALRAAGVPPAIVQYLPGPGSEIGQTLVEHPQVDIIAFTGSNAVGQSILSAAAKVQPGQHNLKRVIAELGGKNAVIIDEDADLDEAIGGSVVSAFGYAGQKCSACSRLIIVGSAYDEAVERLKNAVESLVVGPPHDPTTFVPPVITASARDKINQYIESGMRSAKLLARGALPEGSGYYVRPTVFVDVPLDSEIACDEIFGPVLSVFRARDFEESLEIAMRSSYALTGGVFSRNPRNIDMARERFRVGNLYINRQITGAIVARQPFGGLAMSGVGEKAGGPDYLRQFMEPRVVTESTMRRGFAPEDGL